MLFEKCLVSKQVASQASHLSITIIFQSGYAACVVGSKVQENHYSASSGHLEPTVCLHQTSRNLIDI